MKKKSAINESQFKRIVKKSVNESMEKLLNESIECPNMVKEVYFDGDDSFAVLGTNGRWYSIYPSYGDGYSIPSDEEEGIQKNIIDKIQQSIQNNHLGYIHADIGQYNPLIIWIDNFVIQSSSDEIEKRYELFLKLKQWMEKRGFTYIDDGNGKPYPTDPYYIQFKRNEGLSSTYSPEKVQKLIQGKQNITKKAKDILNNLVMQYGPKQGYLQAARMFS